MKTDGPLSQEMIDRAEITPIHRCSILPIRAPIGRWFVGVLEIAKDDPDGRVYIFDPKEARRLAAELEEVADKVERDNQG